MRFDESGALASIDVEPWETISVGAWFLRCFRSAMLGNPCMGLAIERHSVLGGRVYGHKESRKKKPSGSSKNRGLARLDWPED